MWQVDNKTPFAHHAGAFRDHRGASFWSVWIAATFVLRPDRLPLFAMPQLPVAQAPAFVNDDPDGVMLHDGDLTPPRRFIDLVLRGMAPPTQGKDRRLLFRIGDWEKQVNVSAEPDDDAPVALDGTASAVSDDLPIGRDAKNGNRPRVNVQGDGFPALGPVPRQWPARAALAGTYDSDWQRNRAPLLPSDLDPNYWQAAPRDQWLNKPLARGATLDIGGLGGTGPATATSSWPLPWIRLRTETRMSGQWHAAEAELQSIDVELETGSVRMLYQAVWPIARAADDVKIEKSLIALEDASGFRVSPHDAPRFDRAKSLKEATP